MKKEWRLLHDDVAGVRFLHHAERMKNGSRLLAFVRLVFGITMIVVGAGMMVLPGPGVLGIAFGLALIAGQSVALARRLDRLEVRLRTLVRWSRRRWKRVPFAAKVAMLAVAVVGAAALGFGLWQWWQR